MERQFLDEYRAAVGPVARLRLVISAVMDVLTSVPGEFVRELQQDLKFSLRLYRKRALVTGLAMVALVLAIGAATGVFAVLNAVLLRQLPFHEAERLVTIRAFTNLLHKDAGLDRWARDSSYLVAATEFETAPMNLSTPADGIRANVAITTPGFFEVLGVHARSGRTFQPEDASSPLAVISNSLWEGFFGADPNITGKVVRLNGVALTIIGVAPVAFDYPAHTAVWTVHRRLPMRGAIAGGVVARLRPGVSVTQAQALFRDDVARSYQPDDFKRQWASRARLDPLRDSLAGPVKEASFVLLLVVGLVLLIASSNIAQLFLARLRERSEELALRVALGASKTRLVQQLTTEAIFLTAVSAGVGLLVAHWVTQLAANAQAVRLELQPYTINDWRVLGFCAGLATLTGIVFGVAPALSSTKDLVRRGHRRRIHAATVAVQVGLTTVLVSLALTLGGTFTRLLQVDLGFDVERIVTLNVSLLGSQHAANQSRFYDEALLRLRSVSEVESAGAVNYLPLVAHSYVSTPVRSLEGATQLPIPLILATTPDYFRTMGINILAGRDFSPADRGSATEVALVNEEFSRMSGLGLGVVGRKVEIPGGTKVIVGVVSTTRLRGPGAEPEAQLYVPFDQLRSGPGAITFVARVRGAGSVAVPVIRDAVQQIDSAIPVYDMKTLEQRLRDHLARPRFYTVGVLWLTAFALLVSLIGIYGITSHAVLQQTKEIGIRIAVGASPQRVRWRLIGRGLLPLLVGSGLGVLGIYAATPLLTYLVPSPSGASAANVAWSIAVAVVGGAGALLLATHRVTHADPLCALRYD
jgi:putative ABC transport system permease protein